MSTPPFRTLIWRWATILFVVAGIAARAGDAREGIYRRFTLHGMRDEVQQQAALADSLLSRSASGSDGHRLGMILRARMAVDRGVLDDAERMLDAAGPVPHGSAPILLFAYSEVAGNMCKARRDPEKAMRHAEDAMRIAEAEGMSAGTIDILVLQAAIARDLDEYAKAQDLAIEAEKRAIATGYQLGLCKALVLQSNLFFDRDRPEQAKAVLRKCLSLAINEGFRKIVKLSTGNLASMLQMTDSAEVAIGIYRKAIGFAQATGDLGLEADWRSSMGSVLDDLGRHREAKREVDLALAYYQAHGDPAQQVDAMRYLASIHAAMGQPDTALALAERCLALSRAIPSLQRVVDAELMITELLAVKSDPRLLLHLEQYKLMRDTLETRIANDLLLDKEVRYETEKKELENKALSATNASLALAKRKRGIMLLATVAIAALSIVLSFILHRNLVQRKRLAAKERELYEQRMGDVMRQSEIRSLDSLMQGQEMERKRVAQDLHDRLGSMLSAVKLRFSVLEAGAKETHTENGQQYQLVSGMLDDAVSEVRRVSHDMLKSSLAHFGLKGALEDLHQALSVPGQLEVEMTLFGLESRLDQRVEIAVFRMVQECVGNALKHAKADLISIAVTRSDELLNVMVSDNGKGFDTGSVNEGMGLGNLRHRAAEVRGSVAFDSSPGHGTTITIDVPLT